MAASVSHVGSAEESMAGVGPSLCGTGFESIFSAHFGEVWRNLAWLGVPEPMIADAAKDVFLALYLRKKGFEGTVLQSTWIFGVIVKTAREYQRRNKVQTEQLTRAKKQASKARRENETPEEAKQREAMEMVQATLLQLKDEERAVFVLVELEQLSVRETAEAMNMSVSTCQRRLRAARARFDQEYLRSRKQPQAMAVQP